MARGMVVAYYGELGGRLTAHQKTMLEANAEAIARLKGSAFGGAYEDSRDYSASLYFVPDDTLLVADGTSCRAQIAHGARREARHVARVLADALSAAAR